MISKKKECPPNKIINPKTNRCISINGITAKNIINNKKTFNYLNWENNSCYIDSLFVALFHYKSTFIKKEILQAPLNNYGDERLTKIGEMIRTILINIYNNKTNTCSILRKLFDKYYKYLKIKNPKIKILSSNDNWTTSQNDIFQLLDFLFIIFKIKNTTKIIDANNPPIYTNFVNMIPIDFLMLDNQKKLDINSIYPSYTTRYNLDSSNFYIDKYGIKHNYYTKKTELLKAPFLIIRISRNIGRIKLKTPIILSPYLKLHENKSKLKLISIIIHYGSNRGGHYICLIKNKLNKKWYEYNDLTNRLLKIGSLDDINNNNTYISNAVALVYA